MFKDSKKDTRTKYQVYSKLRIKTPTRKTSGASIVNFEHILHFIQTVIIAEQINAVWVQINCF